jgi:DNA-binding response OmpR family regulator
MSRKVVVIESDQWLGDHYQQVLERHGFLVERASHAYSAIDVIDTTIPDVIVLNVTLSGASGIALLHELQTYVDTMVIPVVVCSNVANLELDMLRPYGVRRLLDSRSMVPDDLVAAVRSVVAA